MNIKIYDIEWDIDEGDIVELPTEVLITSVDKVDEDEISDYLSDEYGFCHNGFKYEIAKD